MFGKLTVLFACALINTIYSNENYVADIGSVLYGDVTTASGQSYTTTTAQSRNGNDVVTIQLYYESLCPDCRRFVSLQFKQTVIDLGSYLDVHTNPYGNAQTKVVNGRYEFNCQHGPAECYGNKLHACAIDLLRNTTTYVVFNSCLMDYSQAGHGSDDAAADACGFAMNIDSESIKQCAKSNRGSELLKFYGDESKLAGFRSVPYILVNGVVQSEEGNFKQNVCKAFRNPPPQCRE